MAASDNEVIAIKIPTKNILFVILVNIPYKRTSLNALSINSSTTSPKFEALNNLKNIACK